jgi:hypothetical protein
MSCLQQKLSWASNAVVLLSMICRQARAQRPVATALLNKVQALLWVAPMLRPLPKLANPQGVMLHAWMHPSLPAVFHTEFGVIWLEVCHESLVAVSLTTPIARHVSKECSGLANKAVVCL